MFGCCCCCRRSCYSCCCWFNFVKNLCIENFVGCIGQMRFRYVMCGAWLAHLSFITWYCSEGHRFHVFICVILMHFDCCCSGDELTGNQTGNIVENPSKNHGHQKPHEYTANTMFLDGKYYYWDGLWSSETSYSHNVHVNRECTTTKRESWIYWTVHGNGQ